MKCNINWKMSFKKWWERSKGPIELICKDLFLFWLMTCVFIFFLLGALQATYHYENTLIKDVNVTLGLAGVATIKALTNVGAEHPKLFIWFFLIATPINFYFMVWTTIKEEFPKIWHANSQK